MRTLARDPLQNLSTEPVDNCCFTWPGSTGMKQLFALLVYTGTDVMLVWTTQRSGDWSQGQETGSGYGGAICT